MSCWDAPLCWWILDCRFGTVVRPKSMKVFAVVARFCSFFYLLWRLCITFIQLLEMIFFIIFIYSDFNCQHEVIDQEKEAIFGLNMLRAFLSYPPYVGKPTHNATFLTCNQTIFAVFFTFSLVFQVPFNSPTLNMLVEQITPLISCLLPFWLFPFYLNQPFFLSHLWEKACSKLSSALPHYKLHCRRDETFTSFCNQRSSPISTNLSV